MPGGDGTGPGGMGPMTGRAAGYCAGYAVPGYMNPVGGRGFGAYGRGRGGGWGRRNWYYATGLTGWQRAAMGPYPAAQGYQAPYAVPYAPAMTTQQQLDALKGQAEYLEDALKNVKKQMDEIQSASGE